MKLPRVFRRWRALGSRSATTVTATSANQRQRRRRIADAGYQMALALAAKLRREVNAVDKHTYNVARIEEPAPLHKVGTFTSLPTYLG